MMCHMDEKIEIIHGKRSNLIAPSQLHGFASARRLVAQQNALKEKLTFLFFLPPRKPILSQWRAYLGKVEPQRITVCVCHARRGRGRSRVELLLCIFRWRAVHVVQNILSDVAAWRAISFRKKIDSSEIPNSIPLVLVVVTVSTSK